MKLRAYLNFGGNCAEAFRFYEQHLGGRIRSIMKHGESPVPGNVPASWNEAVMYACMDLGDSELMGNDVPPERFKPMRSAYLSLTLDTAAEAERVYALLGEGGEVFMPLQETFFSPRFAMLRDRFGTSWMILCAR
jgi:PhnB protein